VGSLDSWTLTDIDEETTMTKYLAPLAAFALLIAAACTADSDPENASASGEVMPAASVAAAPEPTLDDATIVAIFDAANTADIETGQLAVERGNSKDVRDFGAMLVRDHKMVRQQGRDLAARLGVTPTPPADEASARAHADAMSALRSKQGADFDRAFLEHEVKFHQDVIDAVETTLLPSIQNADVKALVVKVAPAFRAHMMGAQKLATQLFQK
jgi:putative membrane protein